VQGTVTVSCAMTDPFINQSVQTQS